MNLLYYVIEHLIVRTQLLYLSVVLIPFLLAFQHRIRKKSWPSVFHTIGTASLIVGFWLVARATYISLEKGGVHDVLDIEVKAGIGILVGAGVCIIADHLLKVSSVKSVRHGTDPDGET